MTLSPDALNPSPISSSSLSLPDDRTKWLTHVTSPIDLDEPLTTRWSACTNCFTSLRLLVIGVQGMVSLNRSSYFCFAFKQQCHCNLKKGIISRQSSCLPLYSSSIKLVQSITWAYWLESSALEKAVCKINALFSLRLAFLVLLFLPVKMRGNQGRNHLPPLHSLFSVDFCDSSGQIQLCFPSSLQPTLFCTPYLNHIHQHESTFLQWWVGDIILVCAMVVLWDCVCVS